MSALATVEASDELRVALERRDPSGAEQLVAQFGDRAYRLAIGITGNPEDAEEARVEGGEDMLKQLAMALLLALVASTGASVAWADVESDGTSINSIQAP